MKAIFKGRRIHALQVLAISMLFVATGPASAIGVVYTNMYVFGDSLSDNGNFPAVGVPIPPPPYAPGRFSNGPVWVEYLADDLGLTVSPSASGGNNYAWGGAKTDGQPGTGFPPFDIGVQKDLFLFDQAGVADANALYVVWAGGNDVFAGDISNSADNIFNLISELSAAGATKFLVPNLIELSPLFAQLNSDVGAALDMAENTLPIDLTRLDVNQLFSDIGSDTFANGGLVYGITDLFTPCFDGTDVCADPDSFLIWDSVPHPTTRGHEIIGDFAFATLTAVPLPAGVWLFASGLGLLAGVRARQQR